MLHRWLVAASLLLLVNRAGADALPDTKALTWDSDLAAKMVAGIDRYLLRATAVSVDERSRYWRPDFRLKPEAPAEAPSLALQASRKATLPAGYAKSVQPNRERFKAIVGAVDPRTAPVTVNLVATTEVPALVGATDLYRVFAVRWPVFTDAEGDGLLLEPKGKAIANVVALPDADWTPEQSAGLAAGVPREAQFARRLAELGCRVVVPTLINREDTWSGNPRIRMTNQPHREFIYRMAYEMGRHVIGYEVQKTLAVLDWFTARNDHLPIGIFGYGEGGMLALYSAALDERVKATAVSGYYVGSRPDLWREPIFRNIWRYLDEFNDNGVIRLIAPRRLMIETSIGPTWQGASNSEPNRHGAASGKMLSPPYEALEASFGQEPASLYQALTKSQDGKTADDAFLISPTDAGHLPGQAAALRTFVRWLQGQAEHDREGKAKMDLVDRPPANERRKHFDPAARQKRQFDQLVNFTQKLMRDSEHRRAQSYWSKLNTATLEKYDASTKPLREQFWQEVIGKLPAPTVPVNPQSRQIFDEPKWKGYEVTLDLYPDVFAQGILCVPKDLKPGERRPVVVCQHGLEGRPTDVVNPREVTKYYNSFGNRLADKGYVVFAPQNPYIGKDEFRLVQRKANPLGLSLFSFIIRQHERILDWLATLPFVDGARIGFYGLSYGGKTAMRVPAVLTKYCCSVCSGDFNEWTWKNVSVDFPGSYMFTPEYEMPEFNLGHTMVYAEMASIIAPRPFMVERGHDDGVGIDEFVNYEFAKVRRLYSRLGIPDRTEIEHFAGKHECHCVGTFKFLAKHLNWKE